MTTETLDAGHDRIERHRLRASTALTGYLAWPGLAQCSASSAPVHNKKTGTRRQEVVYGITGLSLQRADAARLFQLTRHHWRIENQSHWVRDVTFDENRSQVRCGSIPQVMAALRNLVISLMRLNGETNMAAACRRFPAQPWAALALIGIERRIE